MRLARAASVLAIIAGGMLVASPASAQVDQVSVGQPRLGPERATVEVPLTITCEVGFNIAFGDVTVVQSSGRKLAQGSGGFFNDFPGVPCTGEPQVVETTVASFSSFAFKQGKAAVTVNVTVFDPETSRLVTTTVGPESVRIRK